MKGASSFSFIQSIRDPHDGPRTTVCWRAGAGFRKTVARNLWLIRCELILTAGVAGSCGLCAEQDLDWTEYSSGEVLKGTSLMQQTSKDTEASASRLRVFRPRKGPECPPAMIQEIFGLELLLRHQLKEKGPHLELKMQEDVAAHLLERIPIGLVLLDAKHDVILQNRCAQAILDNDKSTRRKSNASPLDRIRSTLSDRFFSRYPSGGCYCVFSPAELQRTCAFLYPVAPGSSIGERRPTTALFLTPPVRRIPLAVVKLMQTYGVTRAEARLAAKLMENHTVAQCAGLLGISVNTARNQLKRIYEKTGTRRQTELLTLLLSSVTS